MKPLQSIRGDMLRSIAPHLKITLVLAGNYSANFQKSEYPHYEKLVYLIL